MSLVLLPEDLVQIGEQAVTDALRHVVRLEDARGCWRVVPRSKLLRDADGAALLRGGAWRRLPFLPTGEVDENGAEILRSQLPAIGPRGPFIASLHLPEGWNPPKPRRV